MGSTATRSSGAVGTESVRCRSQPFHSRSTAVSLPFPCVCTGVFAALQAGVRLSFGFCLRFEECCIGSNPGANLIGLHATGDVNNLDVINSFFHGSHQFAAILVSGGMQVNIQGDGHYVTTYLTAPLALRYVLDRAKCQESRALTLNP